MKTAIAIVVVAAAGAAPAHADTWGGGVEAGVEIDSNVHRVEVDDTSPMPAVAEPAGLVRAGGRGEGAGKAGEHGRWAVAGQGLLRSVATGVRGEDVAVAAAQGQWDRAIGERRARAGVRGSLYDVFDLHQLGRARAFSLVSMDAMLAVAGDGPARITTTVGVRDFRYKSDHDFDWQGLALGARLATTVWTRGDEGEQTLDLAVSYRLDRRAYRGVAFTNGCAPGDMVGPACFVPTALPRRDLHHVAEAELTYTGDVVAGAGYQVTINDSSSYGQSLVRHRVTGSVTAGLPWDVYATGIATLELDQHLDPLLVARDVLDQSFTSIDEENRSALSLRVSRHLGGRWAAEARGAFYADALSSSDDLRFRRTVVYGGLTWNSDD